MADTDFAALRFLPWVREGAAAEIAEGGKLDIKLVVNGIDVPMLMRVLGPGGVTGIDPKQVIRMEPRPGTVDFTPYNFPAVEFDRPDFPWLFTPSKADGKDRILPWLCLVAVRKQPGVNLRFQQGALLPVLEIKDPARPGNELPKLAEAWAWAHAQVAGTSGASTPDDGLATASLNLSRLVCPRRLDANADYFACVVPVFETGRRAGLGLPMEGTQEGAMAWLSGEAAPPEIDLPVYHYWEFRTGPPADFESLVRLLKARPLPDQTGKRDMWIGEAGSGLPRLAPDAPGAVLALEGALRPVNSKPTEWPAVPRAAFQSKLQDVLNAPANAAEQGATDPIVGPPLYGRYHAVKTKVNAADTQPPWFPELNLDPRNRAAAGLGAEVIRRDQESLMAAAWEQVGEIEEANRLLRRGQVARSVSGSIHSKHFKNMPESTLVQVTAPAHAQLRPVPLAGGAPGNPALTLRGQIAGSTITARTTALRKALRPRGPIVRNAPKVKPGVIFAVPLPPPRAMVTIEALTDAIFAAQPDPRSKVRSLTASPQTMNPVFQPGFVWVFTLQAEGAALLPGHWERRRAGEPATGHRPTFLNFQAAATAHEARLPRPDAVALQVRFSLNPMTNPLLAQLDPATTIPSRVLSRIQIAGGAPPAGSGDPLAPVMAAPDFPRPMYEALRDLSPDYLLPGLEHVLPNTATLVATNPPFIESYLAGLSTEMARELLWREFPTDQRGTYFRQFWAASADGPTRQIRAIHEWANPLGKNPPSGRTVAALVLLIRGELLRRYPNTVIYARKAVLSGSRRVPGGVEKYPIFRGSLDPDVTFLGFDLTREEVLGSASDPGWFFVIQEQPTAPRFGLDKPSGFGAAIPKPTKWSDLSWGHLAASEQAFQALTHVPAEGALPDTSGIQQPTGVAWGRNSAHQAFATFQQPVRIAIHAADMIAPEVKA